MLLHFCEVLKRKRWRGDRYLQKEAMGQIKSQGRRNRRGLLTNTPNARCARHYTGYWAEKTHSVVPHLLHRPDISSRLQLVVSLIHMLIYFCRFYGLEYLLICKRFFFKIWETLNPYTWYIMFLYV